MANIRVADLHPVGSELLSDPENYLTDLGDRDLDIMGGGFIKRIFSSRRCANAAPPPAPEPAPYVGVSICPAA